jgi:hypothetical protein
MNNMSLTSRRDNRSLEEFAKQILAGHKLEDKIARAYEVQMGVETENTGVGPDGAVLKSLAHHNVDRVIKGGNALEIKTAPHTGFFTFKVTSLYSCIQQKADMLIYVKGSDYYYIITLDKIEKLIQLPNEIYPAFSPNDMAVRIQNAQFPEYTNVYKWGPAAQAILKGK